MITGKGKMQKYFCDDCKQELKTKPPENTLVYRTDFSKIIIYDICEDCYNELKTLLGKGRTISMGQ